jgi:hypothetical protein
MARKKASTSNATGANQQANGAPPERGAKTAAIRELYGQGITNAKEIADAMQKRGLSVSMPVIYTTIGKLKKGGRRKGGRKAKAAAATAAATPAVEGAKASTRSGGLNADDVGQLAAITKKVGGVDALVGWLNVVRRIQ